MMTRKQDEQNTYTCVVIKIMSLYALKVQKNYLASICAVTCCVLN